MLVVCAFATCAVMWREASAQFREPTRLSSPDAELGEFALGADPFNNVHAAIVEDGHVVLTSWLASGDRQTTEIAPTAGEPELAFGSVSVHLVYSHDPSEPNGVAAGGQPSSERRICRSSRVGLSLVGPIEASQGTEGCRRPDLALDALGNPVIVWESSTTKVIDESGDGEVFLVSDDLGRRSFGSGSWPSVEVDRSGRTHVFFLRNGRIHYATDAGALEPGTFSKPSALFAESPEVQEQLPPQGPPQTGILDGAVVQLAFETEGRILLTDNRSGAFAAPREIDRDGTSSPDLEVTPAGLVALTWIKDGDVRFTVGNSFFLAEPETVFETPEIESSPMITADRFTNLHIAFRRQASGPIQIDGASGIFLTTNAGPPVPKFRIEPAQGEVPLEVRFFDESAGDVSGWEWSFGDGAESTLQNPVHTFTAPGEYEVTLRVRGPGGESAVPARHTVLVNDPSNELWLADVRAFTGQKDVFVPIIATFDKPAQGFQISARFDPAVLEIRTVEFRATNLGGLGPELAEFHVSHEPDDPFIVAGILFDIEPPFDKRALPPGVNQRLANIVVDIRPSATDVPFTEIALSNGIGRPPLNNVITVGSQSVLPRLGKASKITIEPLQPPFPKFFLRGDTDGGGRINLSDPIATLNFLFVGGAEPDCLDAADATDDGVINLTDPLFVLNFLFQAGAYPLPPYPRPGLDPTPDDLPDCEN